MNIVFYIVIALLVIQYAPSGLGAHGLVLLPFMLVVLLAEVLMLGAIRRLLKRVEARRPALYLAMGGVVILLLGEVLLPYSPFGLRHHVEDAMLFDGIKVSSPSFQPLAARPGHSRFLLSYTITFPRSGSYSVFDSFSPSYPPEAFVELSREVAVTVQHKPDPSQFEGDFIFSSGAPYPHAILIDAPGTPEELQNANFLVWVTPNSKINYLQRKKKIWLPMSGLTAAYAAHPSPLPAEPKIPGAE